MAYKIQYAPENTKRYPQVKKRTKYSYIRLCFIVCALAAAAWIKLHGIPDFLIPGDPTVTKEAAALMVDELKVGASLRDAITVFCKEILHGAGIAT